MTYPEIEAQVRSEIEALFDFVDPVQGTGPNQPTSAITPMERPWSNGHFVAKAGADEVEALVELREAAVCWSRGLRVFGDTLHWCDYPEVHRTSSGVYRAWVRLGATQTRLSLEGDPEVKSG